MSTTPDALAESRRPAAGTTDRVDNGVRDVRAERRKRAAVLARQIEDDIAAAGWPVGTVFGTEPELSARYGASRAVLLEAVRLVEHHQVASMRRGPKGGLVVREPDLHGAATALAIYLDHIGTSVVDLMDVRLMLEPLAVRLVAESLSDESIRALREAADEDTPVELSAPVVQLPDRVHGVIAERCGNAVLGLFLEVLEKLNVLFGEAPGHIPRRQAAEITERLRAEHRTLVAAIVRGNSNKAAQLAEGHLVGMRDLMLAARRNPRADAERVGWLPNGTGRYAEVLAQRIRADLARAGVAPGDVFGSEAQIRERYGISRQVLREAVRLLEHHGVAKMRRGPGGGLVATEPDPWASIEAVAVYLAYQQVDTDHLGVVWAAIELATLDRVISRRSESTVAERLRATVDVVEMHTQGADVVLGPSLHRELAALSGNPVLEVFYLILTTLWQRHVLRDASSSLFEDMNEMRVARDAHALIVDAILAGKAAVARAAMVEHLGAVAAPFRRDAS